jgi:type II secretory pathway pseudopilin PulG
MNTKVVSSQGEMNYMLKMMNEVKALARSARLGSTRKRGVTLIEAVLYISIALALIVGGLVFFQQASLAQRVNSAVRNISAVASETRSLYQSSQSFNGVTNSTLINAGAVPTSIVDGGFNLLNEWRGLITVNSNAAGVTTADDSFLVGYENVPTAACTRLGTVDASGSGRAGSGIVSVGFRNWFSGGAFSTYLAADSLLTPALVGEYCRTAAAAVGGNGAIALGRVDMRFLFTR